MRKLRRLLVVGAATLVALAALSGAADAFRVAVSRGGVISAASLGALSFEGGFTYSCSVTLNGSLLSSATIAAGTRIGEITEVRTATCSGGTLRGFLVGTGAAAWPMRVNSVPTGLPNEVRALEVLMEGFSWELAIFGGFGPCLYRGNAPTSLAVAATRTRGVYTTGLLSLLANSAAFVSGSGLCPRSTSLRGTFGLTPQQTLTIS